MYKEGGGWVVGAWTLMRACWGFVRILRCGRTLVFMWMDGYEMLGINPATIIVGWHDSALLSYPKNQLLLSPWLQTHTFF